MSEDWRREMDFDGILFDKLIILRAIYSLVFMITFLTIHQLSGIDFQLIKSGRLHFEVDYTSIGK